MPVRFRSDEPERTDDEHGHSDASNGFSPVGPEPYGARESGEGQNWEHPGQRLQELECVLGVSSWSERRTTILACVREEIVRDLLADADAVGGLADDRAKIEGHLTTWVETAVPAFEDLDERGVGLLGKSRTTSGMPVARAPVDDLVRGLPSARRGHARQRFQSCGSCASSSV